MGMIERLDNKFYRDFQRNWDDRLFRKKLLEMITPESDVLDLDAGAGIVEAMNFKEQAGRVCGIDLDPRVVDNPYLDEGLVADAGKIPYPDASFDVVFADNVMEHIDQPNEVFAEIARVLKPSGKFLFKTPNKNHYMPLIARLTPHGFHQWINRKRGRHETDTFPTRYKCNSLGDVRAIADKAGMNEDDIDLIECRPEYLRFTAPTYLIGTAYERLVNATELLRQFRVLMIAQLSKPVGR